MLTAESVWNNCLKFVKDNIQIQAYKTWFDPIIPLKLEGNVLNIQVPSKFFYEWLEEHYIKLLKLALTKELGNKARLVYIIKMENTFGNLKPFTEKIPSQYKSNIPSQKVDIPFRNLNTQLKNPFIIPGIKNLKIESQLNANYNFDNFLEGDANRLARSAGMAVSNKPGGTSFNPLLIFGGVGGDISRTVKADGNGNVYISGYYSGTSDFDPGASVYNLTSGAAGNERNCYILKLNPTGDFVWVKHFEGALASSSSFSAKAQ